MTPTSPWARWHHERPALFTLGGAIVFSAVIIALVLWLEERTLALIAGGAFSGMLLWWSRTVWREWREAEPLERIIGVLGCVLLFGAAAANLARLLLAP